MTTATPAAMPKRMPLHPVIRPPEALTWAEIEADQPLFRGAQPHGPFLAGWDTTREEAIRDGSLVAEIEAAR